LQTSLASGTIPDPPDNRAQKKEGELTMPEVIVRKGEPIDRALKRLKGKMDSEGIMDEVRRLRAFETPTQKSRRKAKANAKRAKMKFRFNFNA
jgi:small subunit ribosomal protein S21